MQTFDLASTTFGIILRCPDGKELNLTHGGFGPLDEVCVRANALLRQRDALLAACKGILPTIEEWSKPQQGYGGFHGGDPRNFHPDAECSTEEERAAHKAACELADADEAGRELPCPSGWATIGEYRVHINRQPFGLGCYTWEDETMVKMRDTIQAAIDACDKAGGA